MNTKNVCSGCFISTSLKDMLWKINSPKISKLTIKMALPVLSCHNNQMCEFGGRQKMCSVQKFTSGVL